MTIEAPEIDVSPIDEAYSYAALVTDGITARQAMDTGRWLIGDYVRMLVTNYRERTVEQYADDIGIESSRAYEYAGMASFYPLEIRDQLSELDLYYSHMREARRLRDLGRAVEFLKTIALNAWTIQQTRDALKAVFAPNALPNYSDGNAITDLRDRPIDQRPVYQWRGPAMVEVDKQGVVHIRCDHTPEIEPNKRYIVSFEEIED